jgi:hypothetical protein
MPRRGNQDEYNNLQDASDLARATVHIGDKRSGIMALALSVLNVPQHLRHDDRPGKGQLNIEQE